MKRTVEAAFLAIIIAGVMGWLGFRMSWQYQATPLDTKKGCEFITIDCGFGVNASSTVVTNQTFGFPFESRMYTTGKGAIIGAYSSPDGVVRTNSVNNKGLAANIIIWTFVGLIPTSIPFLLFQGSFN